MRANFDFDVIYKYCKNVINFIVFTCLDTMQNLRKIAVWLVGRLSHCADLPAWWCSRWGRDSKINVHCSPAKS